ncbi:pentapeptide repeat-containing protein [Streptomyces lancefieldiae]|uniref:Pentapeptide repeat-containing protein n=1 Tax=Streptomyces lancefieldiae TaxID=3075520 RepID=A0ABU3AFX1_9ACTN|nr:pentapeptide repeat-containing protein [Streptomyces sp. DSM 40712]MDT0609071.1 pentapeptide repeat-containing protein [Streptomyces sp. DSM 40712]
MLTRLRDPATGRALLGQAEFDEARFSGDVTFEEINFSGFCSLGAAVFEGSAYFRDTHFEQDLRFGNTKVTDELWLESTVIDADAWFYGARTGGVLRFCVDHVGGSAMFKGATTGEEAHFTGVRFLGVARFDGFVVQGRAYFDGAYFEDGADFENAVIAGPACFDGAHFHRSRACFDGAELGEEVLFSEAHFQTGATFTGAKIGGDVSFCQARPEGDLSFRRAVFRGTAVIGPLVCPGLVDLSDAVFESAVTLEVAAGDLHCRRTRWASTAALRLRHAAVDISDAVLEFPVTVAGRSSPFVSPLDEQIDEPGLTDARVRVTSVSGVDVAHLVLADVDLTGCRFVETVHLDHLRLEGRCVLPLPPEGVSRRGWLPVRWTRRRTLAEEHHWRASRYGTPGWTPAPEGVETHEPAVLAPVYRQLRKALEDGKNEPGAADFYYGEMEMRRHDLEAPRGERMILGLYWAVSGYGLRAARALAWLGVAMSATVLAMMLWGLPQGDPDLMSKGGIDGRSVTLITKKTDPANPGGPYRRRLSTARFEKSLRVVANSVIFRASGQDLTTAGTYVEMTSRLVEPALLGLAVLAVRSRVKR